jgi:eukaryotic-like serine/threonine-protein kinase
LSVAVPARHRFACPTCRAVFRKGFARCPLDGAPLEELSADPLEGSVFADRYVIEQCVGEGGMGRVYRATHRHMSRLFAIKVLFGEHAADKEMQARFAREAEAACRLRHPNVVSVTDFGATARGLFYLVMDWVEGQPLTQVINREAPLAQHRIADITRQTCLALSHAHEQGLVHRDLKSENIIISSGDNGRELVRLVDFGLAVVMESDANARLTAEGTVYGTPAYMSPEQACGAKLDARTDLFSLGVLIYEMLSGALPFSGPAMDIVRQNMETDPPSIAERVPGLHVSSQLEALSRRLMAKRPQERYQSAGEVVAALDRIQAEWTAPPRMTRARPRMATVQVRRSPRWLRIVTVVMFLSALGIGAVLFVPPVRGWTAGVTERLQRLAGGPADSAAAETAPAPGSATAEPAATAVYSHEAPKPAAEPGAHAPGGQDAPAGQAPGVDPTAEPPVAAVPDGPSQQAAVTRDAPRGRDQGRTGRRRAGRNRRSEARTERPPEREEATPPPVEDIAEAEPEEVSVGELNRLFGEVGAELNRLAKDPGGPEVEAMSREYFDIPIGTAQVNVKQRKDAWVKLQRLRRQARQSLAE